MNSINGTLSSLLRFEGLQLKPALARHPTPPLEETELSREGFREVVLKEMPVKNLF